MLSRLPFILILLPLLFQLIIGTKAIFRSNSLKFGTISGISFISQLVFSFVAVYIVNYNFSKYFEEHPNATKCGMPFLGFIMATLFFIVVLIVVIIIQFLIKKWSDKKLR
ncbi:hypothetical protein [Flavobacterium branchiicola]|uniref:Uncharacterized protein n=1 Tax=Flavobacterium branchiicola TaxID=1114875 RepID=A0ABV9PE81_9FLAO|nr:hypothetical protein [Flavobacterium branchiicola]MBS7253373.1 hypothetical protein [Flavobacterium branchiicola]